MWGWGSGHHGHHHGHHHHGHNGYNNQYGQQGFSVGFNTGFGMGFVSNGFNRWGNSGYQNMNGYVAVDYTNGWNANYHDQLLRNNIDIVYQRYDRNFSGQLQGNEFYYAYRDLCLMMGLCPPNDYHSVWNAARQSDLNGDGRTSKMEMFMLFKRIQGINAGYGF